MSGEAWRALARELAELPLLEPGDRALALALARHAGVPPSARPVVLALALLSRAVQEGHTRLPLARLAREAEVALRDVASREGWLPPAGNAPDAWDAALARPALVGGPDDATPVVRVGEGLQFRRHHDAERRIVAALRRRAARPDGLRIVTGGPGTGKTWRVAEHILAVRGPAPAARVLLAAPTGKAAQRMTEALRGRLARGGGDAGASGAGQDDAATLHRLLGFHGGTERFRVTPQEPLRADGLVVDEASMIDVLLMDALLQRVSDDTPLWLVGDHDQLASVDAGDVLGAVVRTVRRAGPSHPLHASLEERTESFRSASHPGILAVAGAVRDGDGDAVARLLAPGAAGQDDVVLRAWSPDVDALLAPLRPMLERCLAAADPGALLDALEGGRVLCAEREGTRGVAGMNRAVERWLAPRGVAVRDPWYHGRPVMVTANDHDLRVYNGDVGVCWREGATGPAAVYLREASGGLRRLAPERLPRVETAWATTVHKAQGSEFDRVLFVLPAGESRVLSRALVYTGITRARQGVTLVGELGVLRAAARRAVERESGMAALVEGMGDAG